MHENPPRWWIWWFCKFAIYTVACISGHVYTVMYITLQWATICTCKDHFFLDSQHSPSDLLSSDLRNSSETIPTSFTLLHATDVEIGSRLRVHRGGSYVALFEVIHFFIGEERGGVGGRVMQGMHQENFSDSLENFSFQSFLQVPLLLFLLAPEMQLHIILCS